MPNSYGVHTANRSHTTPPSSDHRKGQDAESKKCYIILCGKVGHLQWNCRWKDRKSESTPGANRSGTSGTATNMVSSEEAEAAPQPEDPFGFLLSNSDNEDIVSLVRVQDKGSRSQTAMVEVAGVPVHGIVDTGADITIMGPELFKKVAAIAKLKKSQFKKADKVPHTYDRCQFKLDGRLDLDVDFADKTMNTPIYVKMDAHDDLLLSEGICRHLGIVEYHPSVKSQMNNHTEEVHSSAQSVRVSLVDSVRLEPRKETLVTVRVDSQEFGGPVLLEPSHHLVECYDGRLTVGESLVQVSNEGLANSC